MPAVMVKIDVVRGMSSILAMNAVKLSKVSNGVSSVRNSIDAQVLSRRNIGLRLASAYCSLNNIEIRLKKIDAFITQSLNDYVKVDNYVNALADNLAASKMVINYRWEEGPTGASPKELSFCEKLKVGAAVVVADMKSVCAEFKKSIEPGGKLYKAWKIGNAVTGLTIGVITVLGSGVGVVFSGGTATPIAYTTAVYGLNQIFNSSYDLGLVLGGNYDKVGNFNLLRGFTTGVTGYIGKKLGCEGAGRIVGEVIYYVGDAATVVKGGVDAIKEIKKVGKFSYSGLIKEVKNLPSNIVKTYTNACYQLKKVRGIKQLQQVIKLDTVSELKNIKKISDIKNIKAIDILTHLNYTDTIKKTVKILINKPSERILKISPNITVLKGVREIVKSAEDLYESASETSDYIINDLYK